MSTTVEKIKERLGIVEVVSSYVKLTKAGRNFKGKSPFTNERTPSFFVAPDKNLFHCFSSGKGGDIFNFVQEMEGVDFYTALKLLADRAGVELERSDPKERSELATLYNLLEEATHFYQESLKEYPAVSKYLEDRGVNENSIKNFNIGFAKEGWSNLHDHLKSKGFSDTHMEKAGLVVPGRQGYYDRFRGRIMFPIADSQGRVVAFSGRVFEDPAKPLTEAEKEKQGGKYVNSPEGVLYNKSKILYGYDRAKQALLKEDACIVVEGQLDVVLSHQAGVENTVALSGTALTEDHVRLIGRFTDRIILALDADRAGIAAASRSVKIAFQNGLEVSVIKMPAGKDPADMVKENLEAWKELVKTPKEYVSFRLETLGESGESDRKKKKIVEEELFSYLNEMGSRMEQDHAFKKIANFFEVSNEAVREDFEKWRREHGEKREIAPLTSETVAKEVQKNPSIQTFLGIVLWQDTLPDKKIQKDEYLNKLKGILGESWASRVLAWGMTKKDLLLFEAEMRHKDMDPEKVGEVLDELLAMIEIQALDLRLSHALAQLRQAEAKKDEESAGKFLDQCNTISKKISAIKEKYFI